MSTERVRPAICADEHLEYLDDLRESGETNMWGGGAYLRADFDLSKTEARDILLYWMASFDERHPKGAA